MGCKWLKSTLIYKSKPLLNSNCIHCISNLINKIKGNYINFRIAAPGRAKYSNIKKLYVKHFPTRPNEPDLAILERGQYGMSLDFQLSKNNKTVTKLEPYFDLSKHQKLVTLCSTLVYENEPKEGMLKKQKFQWHKSGSYEDPSYFTTKRRDYAMYEKTIFMHNEITNEMFQVKKKI